MMRKQPGFRTRVLQYTGRGTLGLYALVLWVGAVAWLYEASGQYAGRSFAFVSLATLAVVCIGLLFGDAVTRWSLDGLSSADN